MFRKITVVLFKPFLFLFFFLSFISMLNSQTCGYSARYLTVGTSSSGTPSRARKIIINDSILFDACAPGAPTPVGPIAMTVLVRNVSGVILQAFGGGGCVSWPVRKERVDDLHYAVYINNIHDGDITLTLLSPPIPSVTITNPTQDTTVYIEQISDTSKTIILQGVTNPVAGIGWYPNQSLHIGDFYAKIKGDTIIRVMAVTKNACNDSNVAYRNIKMVKLKKYCQADTNWSKIRYDSYVMPNKAGKDSLDAKGNKVYFGIGRKGCSVSCLAMVALLGGSDVDPGKLGEFMRDNKGFTGVRVIWNILDKLSGYSKFYSPKIIGAGLQYDTLNHLDIVHSKTIALSQIDTCLANGGIVIVQVLNPSTNNNHWVVVYQKSGSLYKILDPGCYPGRDDLSSYNSNAYRFIMFSRK